MRAVLQRVCRAEVRVGGEVVGRIGRGWLILVGVARGDTEADAAALATRVAHLRGFADAAGKMNLDLVGAGGGALVVSQFTLLADTGKGRRPSFLGAAPPDVAERLYLGFVAALRGHVGEVATGTFRADMAVELVNDGPVTFVLDTGDSVGG